MSLTIQDAIEPPRRAPQAASSTAEAETAYRVHQYRPSPAELRSSYYAVPLNGIAEGEHFFSSDYQTAKNRFRQAAASKEAKLHTIPLGRLGPDGRPGRQYPELSIDIAWIGPACPKKVLFHSSGIHGPEGFKGSAVQLKILHELKHTGTDTAIVLVHALNPFGMQWTRRVDASNRDLNRANRDTFPEASPLYQQYEDLINPKRPPPAGFDFSMLHFIFPLLQHGVAPLQQALAGGQSSYPEGLQYAGDKRPPEFEALLDWLSPRFEQVERLIGIDEHTGHGDFGTSTLIASHDENTPQMELLGGIYDDQVKHNGSVYRIDGSFLAALSERVNSEATALLFLHEHGSLREYPPLYRRVKQLQLLKWENAHHHYSGALDTPEAYTMHWTKEQLRGAYNPTDANWQSACVRSSYAVVQNALFWLRT